MKWPWSGRPTGRATDCNSAYAGSNPARSNTATEKVVSTLVTEWVEIEQGDFTFAVGRTGTPGKLRVRVTGKNNAGSARIEWDIDAPWLRDLLDKWFPVKPPDNVP
jgi:hypothetical protein